MFVFDFFLIPGAPGPLPELKQGKLLWESMKTCQKQISQKGNKIMKTVSHLQKAKDIGGTYSTPPLATIMLVAIKIG